MKRPCLILLALTALCVAKEWKPYELDQLKGLRRVQIFVESLSEDGRMAGLSERELTRRMSDKLTDVGLSIADSTGLPATLYLSLHAIRAAKSAMVYSIELEFCQPAYLIRNEAFSEGTIHLGGRTGYCPEEELSPESKETIDAYVNDFVIGWLLANKK